MFLRNLSLFAGLLCVVSLRLAAQPVSSESKPEFENTIRPFLVKNCVGCHSDRMKAGDLSLQQFKSAESIAPHTDIWEIVVMKLMDGTMPPKGIPRPPQEQVESVASWIRDAVTQAELASKPDPGRVTARRLNRAEYNNTIRDLLGVDFRPADDFPQDDSGYGFDNIGDVLSLSPVLLEKYLKAAESAVKLAVFGQEKMKPLALRAQPPGREFPLHPKAKKDYDETGLSMPNALHANMRFPGEGKYKIRVAIEGRRPDGSEPVQIGVWIDGKLSRVLEIDQPSDGNSIDLFGAQVEFETHLTAGDHWIAGTFVRMFEGLPPSYEGPNPSRRPIPPGPDIKRFMKIPPGATEAEITDIRKRAEERMRLIRVPANRLWVHFIEATGPYEQVTAVSSDSRKQIFVCSEQASACEQKILSGFARRAFRRPVTAAELKPYLELVQSSRKNGSTFDEAIAVGLQAVLVSPDFLFRIEKTEPLKVKNDSAAAPIDQFALATRLSYFLWSSTPDDELLRLAEQGNLRKPEILSVQVKRMLKDPKSRTLVENFAGQWLELRRLESTTPDREKFPEFDDYLRMSMRQETETFFENIIRNDLSILEMVDARYTFANEKLADFYGIPGVKGTEFRKVDLKGTPRKGILTHASILTVSSYATRTSPTIRGKWILENFLNEPIPPPPPNVPALDEEKIGASGSLREQMEEHRTNPVCASCHAKMDPIGFGFENFSAIGAYRTKDGNFEIDASGALPNGREFKGSDDLIAILGEDKNAFVECITDKMLTYALGRGLERYDRRTVKDIARKVAANDYRFSNLVMEIINSLPFQKARQERNKS